MATTGIDRWGGVILICITLGGCDPFRPTDAYLREVFANRSQRDTDLPNLCVKHRGLKAIEDDDVQAGYGYAMEPNEAESILAEARVEQKAWNFHSVYCRRGFVDNDWKLYSVDLVYFAQGLTIAGSVKGIRYIFIYNSSVQADIDSGNLRSLGKPGWYIFEYEN